MKFSIITPCFNSVATIRETFEAVLNQTFTDYEYIVVDGGSKDGTLDIIQEYEAKFNGKMRWISEPDNGIYDAMNKGIRMAQGEVIGIVNSDDWYEKNALEKIAEQLSDDYDFYYGMIRNVDSLNREMAVVRFNHEFLRVYVLQHPGCFVTKKTYEKYGLYSLEYKIAADYELMLRFQKEGVRFLPVDAILTNFSTCGISNTTPAYELFAVRRKYGITSRIGYIAEVAVEFFLKKILKR
jgi:glycosyltransferase involved in cell wall biosynthesis